MANKETIMFWFRHFCEARNDLSWPVYLSRISAGLFWISSGLLTNKFDFTISLPQFVIIKRRILLQGENDPCSVC